MRSEGRYAAKQLSRNERVCVLRGTVGLFGEALNYPSASILPELSGSTLLVCRDIIATLKLPASTAWAAGLAYQTNVIRAGMYDERQSRPARRYLRHRLACSSYDIDRALLYIALQQH